MIRYSAATGGFYHTDLHAEIPADAVTVSARRHAALIDAQAAGGRIVADSRGRPIVATDRVTIDQARSAAAAAIRRETRRRILAIASLERQSNDTAAIALAALGGGGDTAEAIARREAIEAVRARGRASRAELDTMTAAKLAAFDPAAEAHWTEN